MIPSEINPFGVLELPFGASRDEATRAFARRARGVRHQPGGGDQLERLTAALRQVEEAIDNPDVAVGIYRVPADPEALEPDGHGVLKPAPIPLARTTIDSTSAWQDLLNEARREALRGLIDALGRVPQPER